MTRTPICTPNFNRHEKMIPLSINPQFGQQFVQAVTATSRRPVGPHAGAWDDMVMEMADDECGLVIDRAAGIAIQPVYGFIAAGCDAEDEAFCGCFNTLRIMDTCSQMRADTGIKALILHICSPGGSVMALTEACQSLIDLQAARPDCAILSYIDGCGCSAAARLAAACSETHATTGSMVGSIGTILVNYDTAGMYEQAGIKVRAFTDGVFKSMGAPGVPLSDQQAEFLQGWVAAFGHEFKAFMAGRRGLEDADMQGQPFIASPGHYPEALLDGIAWTGIEQFTAAVAARLAETVNQPA
jgi:ClpP class serine protease